MKVGEIIRQLEDDGWYMVATRGSHRQYEHRSKRGRLLFLAGYRTTSRQELLNSALKQAGLKEKP